MTQENQGDGAAVPALTDEEIVARIEAYRDAVVDAAIRNELSFDIVFTALSQVVSAFAYEFLLATEGTLSDENVATTVARFNKQTDLVSQAGLNNLRESFRKDAETEANSQV